MNEGDRSDLLLREPVVVRQDNPAGAEAVEPDPGDLDPGDGGGHQPDHRVLLLRALLRHLLQVLGARQGPRPLHRQGRPCSTRRRRSHITLHTIEIQ